MDSPLGGVKSGCSENQFPSPPNPARLLLIRWPNGRPTFRRMPTRRHAPFVTFPVNQKLDRSKAFLFSAFIAALLGSTALA
jgi:hypothetical protein